MIKRIYGLIRRHRFITSILALIVVFSAGAAGLVIANSREVKPTDLHIVSLYVDGREVEVPTRSRTVGEFIDKSGVSLSEGDLVEPDRDQIVDSDSYKVRVVRARPYVIRDGDSEHVALTAQTEPRLIAKSAGLTTRPADKVEFAPLNIVEQKTELGRVVEIVRSKKINLFLYGQPQEIYTNTNTVSEFLDEIKLVPAPDDELIPARETATIDGMQVFVNRNGVKVETVEEVIEAPIEYIDDPSLTRGSTATRDPGAEGKRSVTYEITTQNGVETGRKELQSIILVPPLKKIIIRGSGEVSGDLQQWLYTLRMCESGGNYQISTGNGFYGAYQFMKSTWDRIATRYANRPDLANIYPHEASPADQDYMIIVNTNVTSGLRTQNPGCYEKHALSNYPPAN